TQGIREFEHGENAEQTPDILLQTQRGDCADHHFAWSPREARHAIRNRGGETRGIDTVWDIDNERGGQSPNAAGQILESARGDDNELAAGERPSPKQHPARDLRISLAYAEAGFQMQMSGNRGEPAGRGPFDRTPIVSEQ